MRPRRVSSASNPCLVCCHSIDNVTRFQTVGQCNHTGCCSLCVLRMRQILKNNHCSLCKTEMARVICVSDENTTFESFQDWGDNIGPTHVFDEASAMYFLKDNYKAVVAMRSFACPIPKCPEKAKSFANYGALKNHLSTKHGGQSFCDICVEHNNLFIQEQTLFSREGLKKHTMKGNPEQGFLGHPKCDFCGQKYYSNQELYEHLRKNHFECEICLHGHGIENRYYKDYNDLEKHFRAEHFLCEEHSCLQKKFVVFKDHLQFQSHMANEHPHIRTSKKIDVNFSVRRGDREGRDAYTGYGFREDELLAAGMLSSAAGGEAGITVADFPALSNADAAGLSRAGAVGAPPAPAYRNAIAPPPTRAMMAHLHGGDQWDHPELQQAANALGANNPLMRFVKPKKNKKKKATQLLSDRLDEIDDEEEKPPAPTPAPAPVAAPVPTPEVSVVDLLQEALGSEAKFIQFREVCKKFRQKDIPAVSFYSLARAMFRPDDFVRLFPKLMSLLPDESQVAEVMALHAGKKAAGKGKKTKPEAQPAVAVAPESATSVPPASASPVPASSPTRAVAPVAVPAPSPTRAADLLGRRQAPPSLGDESWPAPQPVAAPAPAPKKTQGKKQKAPAAATGWSNVFREVGAAAVPKNRNGPKMNLVVHNTDGFSARSRNTKAAADAGNSWSSSASWSDPVSVPTVATGATPSSTKIQVVSQEDVYGMDGLDITRALQPNKVPSRTKSDFPDLPKAGPAIGVQPVHLGRNGNVGASGQWGEKATTPEHSTTSKTSKKNKKKTMSLAEVAMKFG
ncbi:hypothetical protein SPRG_02446 [Saprolegnia parasitica CBS 223.65]|uniref:RING-type E3 ubiquitin transferase n=1 Tax=Saprolegnia parasitica (strain CBS 223.65) TaxID=695850 RepID=A0A067CQJ0_SAPPC|nr:hypothetical protein SPRG_02446 [Saprolegnia parasitica CBS 223.65]KDO32748.1 hypothetical protein SPRG_02446 [Saprolegnia parasitica CBS 223.65]|eukprot:XP_012196412.1 hypothetical protein SPRG_02446 [Saprolegnia parasitica CBS 223.65]